MSYSIKWEHTFSSSTAQYERMDRGESKAKSRIISEQCIAVCLLQKEYKEILSVSNPYQLLFPS